MRAYDLSLSMASMIEAAVHLNQIHLQEIYVPDPSSPRPIA